MTFRNRDSFNHAVTGPGFPFTVYRSSAAVLFKSGRARVSPYLVPEPLLLRVSHHHPSS